MDFDTKLAHAHCIYNRAELQISQQCGCFYCCAIFLPSKVEDWCDDGETALCPFCGVDSIVGDASGFEVTQTTFLQQMRQLWF